MNGIYISCMYSIPQMFKDAFRSNSILLWEIKFKLAENSNMSTEIHPHAASNCNNHFSGFSVFVTPSFEAGTRLFK